MNLAAWIIKSLTPLFTAADVYVGLTIIYGAIAFFWFIGIQGPQSLNQQLRQYI